MSKKAVLIHGWGGNPKKDWFVWLDKELRKKNWEVLVPKMPDTFNPIIDKWISFLNKKIKKLDENTYLIGHSIGSQALMRYVEQLPKDVKIGGIIFVAGWFNLSDNTWDEDYKPEIAEPWIKTPVDFNKIKSHTSNILAIFSDNDPYVPMSDSKIFKDKLGARIIIENSKGHISGEDGVKEYPLLLEELTNMSK